MAFFDSLHSAYTCFLRELNDIRKQGTVQSAKIMVWSRCRLLESIMKTFMDWYEQVQKANRLAYDAARTADGLDTDTVEHNGLQDIDQRAVSKMFGSFKRIMGGEKVDNVSVWLRLIPKPLLASDPEIFTSDVKKMDQCRRTLQDVQFIVAVLSSGLDAFFGNIILSIKREPVVALDRSTEDILASIERGLWSIKNQIKLSPWDVL